MAPSVRNSDLTLINISFLSVNNQASRWQILIARKHHNNAKKMPPSENSKLTLTSKYTPNQHLILNESPLIYSFHIQIGALLKEVLQ